MVRSDSLAFRRVAVRFLAGGKDEISDFRGTVETHFHGSRFIGYGGGSSGEDTLTLAIKDCAFEWSPIVPTAPYGLELDDVHDLVQNADPRTVALAGYLAALLGDARGLEVLVRSWQSNGKPSRWYVYRAIAVADDPQYIPVLRKIYETWYKARPSIHRKHFYWTIRIMSGPEILKFRKEIRDEIGGVGKLRY
jgi:hypothetical protein